MATTITEKIK